MVSTFSIAAMVAAATLSMLLPIILFFYYRRKEQLSLKVAVAGMATFIIFAMILERILHTYLLTINPTTQQWLSGTAAYVLYGSLAAGLFEEGGRFLVFRFLLKSRRSWSDGLAFGLGHGGIEAILLGGTTTIQNIIFALSLNAGTLEQSLAGTVPPEIIAGIKATLLTTSPFLFLVSGVERMMALIMQISLSLLVLYGVRTERIRYLFWAIGLHALFDIPAGLFQKQVLGLMSTEAILAVFAILLLLLLRKGKHYFTDEAEKIH